MTSLEQRMQRLEDERAIGELIARYCYLADSGRDDELLDLFTDDGRLGSTVGKPAIAAQIANPDGHHRPDLYRKGMHLLSNNLVVEVDGDDARASSYSLLVLKRDDGLELFSASANRWGLRRADGAWRVVSRDRREIADGAFGDLLLGIDVDVKST